MIRQRNMDAGRKIGLLAKKEGLFAVLALFGLGVSCFKSESQPEPPPPPLVDPADVLLDDETAEDKQVDPDAEQLTVNKEIQISILGYHDFVERNSKNPMMINIKKFREQMQALKDADIDVISFDDFFAWRRGEKELRDPSVIITMDDGWRSTYDLAWPVLKEFDYPFTVFLYKNYVGGGGRALTYSMIKEMIAEGVDIGSHTVSHPLRKSQFLIPGKRTPEEFSDYLTDELNESKDFLERTFEIEVKTFAYPGGMYNDEIIERCKSYGYTAMVTCNPSRTTWDTPLAELNRYIIHGNNDLNFNFAMRFRQFSGTNSRVITPLAADAPADTQNGDEDALVVRVHPAPDSTVESRFPAIEIDLSKVAGEIDPESLSLKMSGVGVCRHVYDPETRMVHFTPPQALRSERNELVLNFKRTGQEKNDTLGWEFRVDLSKAYLPQPPPPPPVPVPVPEPTEEASQVAP